MLGTVDHICLPEIILTFTEFLILTGDLIHLVVRVLHILVIELASGHATALKIWTSF